MRKIPIKNYIIAIIISILTVGLVLKLTDIYNSQQHKINFITEISEKDLDYYVAENNDVLIYMTTNRNSKEINKQFKKYLKNKEIDIIYIDLNEVSDDFKDNFRKKYFPKYYSNTFIITDTTLVLIEDGMISKNLYNITDFEQIKEFIERSNIK